MSGGADSGLGGAGDRGAVAAAPRAVLADDERLMREQLRARLADAWPELVVAAEARHGEEAVAMTAEHRPDVVFLDIRMPGLDGIGAARRIAQLDVGDDGWLPEVVFVTAFDEYAVQAFDEGAADYVLKPAEPARLARTVARLRRRLAQRVADAGAADAPSSSAGDDGNDDDSDGGDDAAPLHPTEPLARLLQRLDERRAAEPRPRLRWIQASSGSTIQMIPVDEVLFFASDEKYTRVQTATQEALIRKPIKELVDELDAERFWQIHRSTLVAVDAIGSVARDFRGRLIVSLRGHPHKLEVSRSYAHLFKGM